jgi:hypothetical protein
MADDAAGKLDRARSRLALFEQMVSKALGYPLPSHPLLAWRLEELVNDYLQAKAYPVERLPGIIDRAIDLKAQLFFILDTLGIHNELISGRGFDLHGAPMSQPRLRLRHLAVMQSLIGQTRVLWERLMTLVYYLETGKDPDAKSIRRVFFRDIQDWSGKWGVLAEWESSIDAYDTDFRTPEYHTRSRMRKELFGDAPTDPNEVFALVTPVMNGFWEVLIAYVRGVESPVISLGRTISNG